MMYLASAISKHQWEAESAGEFGKLTSISSVSLKNLTHTILPTELR